MSRSGEEVAYVVAEVPSRQCAVQSIPSHRSRESDHESMIRLRIDIETFHSDVDLPAVGGIDTPEVGDVVASFGPRG